VYGITAYSEAPYSTAAFATGPVNVDVILTSGVSGEGEVGTVEVQFSYAVTGKTGTGSIGTVTVPVIANINTGVTGTGAVNSVGYALAYGVTGETGTGSVGTVGNSLTVNVTGQQGTGSVGTVIVPTGTVINADSLSGTGSVAGGAGFVNLLIDSEIVIDEGVTGTGEIYDVGVTVPISADVVVTGVSAVALIGNVFASVSYDTIVVVTGVSATGRLGRVSVWGAIDPPLNETWTNIPASPASSWGNTAIPAPSPNWSAVAA
jgi:hypothetical protein